MSEMCNSCETCYEGPELQIGSVCLNCGANMVPSRYLRTFEQLRKDFDEEDGGISAGELHQLAALAVERIDVLMELLREPMEYAESRPEGDRGWKRWLAKVKEKLK